MPFPVDEKYIETAELELNIRFPQSFRQNMMLLNGGEVEVGDDSFELYPFYDTSDVKRIKRTCNSIVHETQKERQDYGLAENLVVIGHNGSGDLLVYKVEPNGSIADTVYLRDHETGELLVVASDFSMLIQL